MALKPVTVSQLNEYIARVISTDPLLGAVAVKGELSNLKYHSSGHVYFSIMDEASKINCFLPREYAAELPQQLTDGMEVILTGGVNVFKKNGTYSIYVRNVELTGAGNLSAALEKIKAKLMAEGLFDPSHKKPLPPFPEKVGIITSKTGAAVRDILKILRSRNNIVDIAIFPVLVQGDGAASDISSMIDFVSDNRPDIDVLIVGRGGGSADDLWAFNEECVVRSIYRCKIPVISAVGHEIDFTLSDLAADVRAETPTAAAQIAVPDVEELKEKLSELRESLQLQLSNKLMYNQLLTENLITDMKHRLLRLIDEKKSHIEQYRLILQENNPVKILENGFAVLTDQTGRTVTSAKQLNTDESYRITLKDGFAICEMKEIGSDDRE
ncbi:MAG: exodeoxyribonuclease VII large subunit [Anaerovoracaceae bacterium]